MSIVILELLIIRVSENKFSKIKIFKNKFIGITFFELSAKQNRNNRVSAAQVKNLKVFRLKINAAESKIRKQH